jgi:hypothetical protein
VTIVPQRHAPVALPAPPTAACPRPRSPRHGTDNPLLPPAPVMDASGAFFGAPHDTGAPRPSIAASAPPRRATVAPPAPLTAARLRLRSPRSGRGTFHVQAPVMGASSALPYPAVVANAPQRRATVAPPAPLSAARPRPRSPHTGPGTFLAPAPVMGASDAFCNAPSASVPCDIMTTATGASGAPRSAPHGTGASCPGIATNAPQSHAPVAPPAAATAARPRPRFPLSGPNTSLAPAPVTGASGAI